MRLRHVPLAALGLIAALAAPAHALRVVTWNLWQYPGSHLATRQPLFRTVLSNLDPDVLVTQEITGAGADSMMNVLEAIQPGQWRDTTASLATTNSVIFYKWQKVAVTFVSTIATAGPRDVLFARVTPAGYTHVSATFRVYSVHFKAGNPASSPADSTTRRLEATDLRNTLNLAPAGTNFLVAGDYNLYGAYEGAYLRLTESQADNDGRCKDPLTLPGNWHQVPSYSFYYTQCPCNSGCLSGFSGGGMDDRFDLILGSYSMFDGEGVDIAVSGLNYYAYGNDGDHYNDDINGDGRNGVVPLAVANALRSASDHLPVVFEVQVAAKVAAASQVAFGSAIVGGVAEQALAVANGATPFADELNYSFAAPAGFTAPAGSFMAFAGQPANGHTLGMATTTPGAKSGTLVMTTDDRDSLSKNVQLSGTVLGHASASLDSTAALTGATLDFGTHGAGGFPVLAVRAHNLGYGPLQARLSLDAATITPAGSRFSLTEAFTPGLLAGVGRTFSVQFDASGATPDSSYEDTLRIATSDEPLPGATPQATLTVLLRATTEPGPVDVPSPGALALRFHAPRPNPLGREATFAFDLPAAADVALEVFDLGGRRVASVAGGAYPAGSHRVRWNARGDDGARLGAGLYFARLRTAGLDRTHRLIILP